MNKFDKITSDLYWAELRKKKEQKTKYYKKRQLQGEVSYGIGKEYRLLNTRKDRDKNRYGFKRYSIRQKGPLSKAARLRIERPYIKCYKRMAYVSMAGVNALHGANRVQDIIELIYVTYYNFQTLMDDAYRGFKDPIWKRVLGITGVLKSPERYKILQDDYLEILHEVIIELYSAKDLYIPEYKRSFYTHLCYVLPLSFLAAITRRLSLSNKNEIANKAVYSEYNNICEDNFLNIYVHSLWIRNRKYKSD